MESISRLVDNVFYIATDDLIALLLLIENGSTLVFVGLVTFGDFAMLTKNGLAPVFVSLASSSGLVTLTENNPTLVMINLASFVGRTSSTWSYWYSFCFNLSNILYWSSFHFNLSYWSKSYFKSLGVSKNMSACIGLILLVGSLLNSCTCKFKMPLSRPFNLLDS